MSPNAHRHIVQALLPIVRKEEPAEGIYLVHLRSEHLARHAEPGQFVNIRCGEGCLPLLRRPFSIAGVEGDCIHLLFNVIGQGTRMLASRRAGDQVDVLGPLGKPFRYEGEFEIAILVGGGLGVAPLPFLTDRLLKSKKEVLTFVGARTSRQLVRDGLVNVQVATDDGSSGFHGNVVDALRSASEARDFANAKVFGCGPTPMLKALGDFTRSRSLGCELSLEGDMACGIGLCQGCPVERTDGKKKYSLVCVDGPTFDSNDIVLR